MNVPQVCSRPALNRPARFERTNSGEQLDELFESISRKGLKRPQHHDHVGHRANNTAIGECTSQDRLVIRSLKASPDVMFSSSNTKTSSDKYTPSSPGKDSSKNAWKTSCRASLEPTLKHLKSAAARQLPLSPTSVISPANTCNNSRVTSSILSLPWIPQAAGNHNNVFSNKAVFYRHLTRPAIRIQSIVRGMLKRKKYRQLLLDKVQQGRADRQAKAATRIQARFRGNTSRRFVTCRRAAIQIQAMSRAWLGRIKFQIVRLQHKLHSIESVHQLELHRIEAQKNREMQHFYRELYQQVVLEEEEQVTHCSGNWQLVKELRESNLQLRQDNQEMYQAMVDIKQRNEKLAMLTELTQFNITKLEAVIKRLSKDVEMGHFIVSECIARVDEFEAALTECEEYISYEKHLGHTARLTIASLLEYVDTGCSDEELKGNIIGSTTADVEKIRKVHVHQ